jgi:NAD(P)-dependent dehydrogenase (short-subunit alcohol dehydrogenase family)
VVNGLTSNFLTSRAAGRRMIEQGHGVILHLNSASGAAAMPGMGSTGPADAASGITGTMVNATAGLVLR